MRVFFKRGIINIDRSRKYCTQNSAAKRLTEVMDSVGEKDAVSRTDGEERSAAI